MFSSFSNLKKYCKKNFAEFLKTKDIFDLIPIPKHIWNPLENLWVQYIEKLYSKDYDHKTVPIMSIKHCM